VEIISFPRYFVFVILKIAFCFIISFPRYWWKSGLTHWRRTSLCQRWIWDP